MARLLSWPIGLVPVSMTRLSGPRVRGEASESIGGYVQTSANSYGLHEWQMDLYPMRDRLARAWRGLVVSLHGGANAVRVPFFDPDKMTPFEAGMPVSATQETAGTVNWSNNLPWDNNYPWDGSYPIVSVASAAAKDATVISLTGGFWADDLKPGDRFGFMPLHLGVYEVTEAFGFGQYRIWPPLRKAVATTDYATLFPVMAMRLKSVDGANDFRDVDFARGLSIRLIEVPDYTVREAFTE